MMTIPSDPLGSGSAGAPHGSLRRAALDALLQPGYDLKSALTRDIDPHLPSGSGLAIAEPAGIPGREPLPRLVPHLDVKKRSVNMLEGRAALLHALAHIELNAIDLALDAVWRFSGMPDAYYREWMQVAAEEAYHFQLLRDHLRGLGYAYGDFPAHNGLWEMAERTREDALARMALVPRTLEARGLDASPAVRQKLLSAGDEAAAAILDIILRDEIGHVAVGNRWYRWLCAQRGLDPVAAYPELARAYGAPRPRGPFNLEARRQAGFEPDELDWLESAP